MDLINADVAFLAMLGSAIWTSLQLAQRSLHSRGVAQTELLGRAPMIEGLVCTLIWLVTSMIAARGFTPAVLLQSLFVGLIWAGFGYVARLPFGRRSHATR
jgi:hypothetical protein